MAINYSKLKNKNTVFGGTDSIIVPVGGTGTRAGTELGQLRYNTDLGFLEQYNATGWAGIDAPPTVGSISPTSFDGTSGTVITVNGSNFKSGSTVSFITTTGTVLAAGVSSFIDSTQMTGTLPRDVLVTEEPLSIRVTNPSGLASTLEGALDAGDGPTWSTGAGTIATIADVGGSYSPITTVTATDPDGGSVTYSRTSGSFPGNVSLNTSNGQLSGDPTNVSSQTTYTFEITATDQPGNTTARSFSIIVNPGQDGTTSARAVDNAQQLADAGVASGTYWVNIHGTPYQMQYDNTDKFGNGVSGWINFSNSFVGANQGLASFLRVGSDQNAFFHNAGSGQFTIGEPGWVQDVALGRARFLIPNMRYACINTLTAEGVGGNTPDDSTNWETGQSDAHINSYIALDTPLVVNDSGYPWAIWNGNSGANFSNGGIIFPNPGAVLGSYLGTNTFTFAGGSWSVKSFSNTVSNPYLWVGSGDGADEIYKYNAYEVWLH